MWEDDLGWPPRPSSRLLGEAPTGGMTQSKGEFPGWPLLRLGYVTDSWVLALREWGTGTLGEGSGLGQRHTSACPVWLWQIAGVAGVTAEEDSCLP